MMKLEDFCYMIDSQAPDHFKFLKEVGKLPESLQRKEDMDKR